MSAKFKLVLKYIQLILLLQIGNVIGLKSPWFTIKVNNMQQFLLF